MERCSGAEPRRSAGAVALRAFTAASVGAYLLAVAWRLRCSWASRRQLRRLLDEAAGPDARVVITGADRGIGLELAQQFAKHPSVSLLLGCRAGSCPPDVGRATVLRLELLDLDSVQAFANEAHQFLAQGARGLRLIVNNAGVKERRHSRTGTRYAVSATWQVNFIAPFLLTELLGRRREAAGVDELPARVVQVSSGREHESRLDEAVLDAASRGEPGNGEYADSKRALLLWTSVRAQSLAFRAALFAHAANPGRVDTRLGCDWVPDWLWVLTKPIRVILFRTVAEGALSVAAVGLHPRGTGRFGHFLGASRSDEDLVVWRMPEKQLAVRLVRWAGQVTDLEGRSLGRPAAPKPVEAHGLAQDEDRWSSPERRLRRMVSPTNL